MLNVLERFVGSGSTLGRPGRIVGKRDRGAPFLQLRLKWRDLGNARAAAADGAVVEIDGFPAGVLPSERANHFILTFEPGMV